MSNPQFWWYVTRASAIIAWSLLIFSALWGILLSTRIFKSFDNPAWLADLHKHLSSLALFFVSLHMISLYLDSYVNFSLADLLVPFNSDYVKSGYEVLLNIPTALGVISFWFMLSIYLSSQVMKQLPRKFWKGIHYTSYLVLILVSFHAGWTGTDVGAWGYQLLALFLIITATAATLLRIMYPKTSNQLAVTLEGREPEREPRVKSRIIKIDNLTSKVRFITFEINSQYPSWEPGSHLNLKLPNGLQRQYSICSDPADKNKISVAVALADDSRGGSSFIHSNLKAGDVIEISYPRNNFPLKPAKSYRFVAGGIGITAIKNMIESLPASRNWQLYYLGRSIENMPFVEELRAKFPKQVTIHVDDQSNKKFDLKKILASPETLYYVCGPEPLLKGVQEVAPQDQVNFERFSKVVRAEVAKKPFKVFAEQSKIELKVSENESTLQALERSGVVIYASCREGVCGTCETKVLAGQVTHADSVAEDSAKDLKGVFYPCVSRASSEELVLDL